MTSKKKLKKKIKGERPQNSIRTSLPYRLECSYDKLIHIDELHLNPDNPNKHPEKQVTILAQILKDNGVRRPIRVSTLSGLVSAGHCQIMAFKINGWDYVPVDFQDYENEADEWNDVVADNAISQMSELDLGKINQVIVNLGPDYDVSKMGLPNFKVEPADKTLIEGEDDVLNKFKKRTKPGDLWRLGDHYLLCGDSTNKDDVTKLLHNKIVDITFTSPPYNAGCFGYDKGKDKYKGKSDNKSQGEYFKFLCNFTDICLDKSNYVFLNNQFLSGNRHALAKFFGFYHADFKEIFPWIKNTAPPNVNKGVFTNRFEFILCLEKSSKKKAFPVDWRGQFNNIIEGHTAAKENITAGTHSATMPLYVIEWFIDRMDFIKTIYDPFGGSGTTLMACEKNNLKCFTIEIDPKYCDIILQRYEELFGKKVEKIKMPKKKAETAR